MVFLRNYELLGSVWITTGPQVNRFFMGFPLGLSYGEAGQ